jgi:hypothetical protein
MSRAYSFSGFGLVVLGDLVSAICYVLLDSLARLVTT